MIISVIVPTYRRPKDLSRCLETLGKQTRSANEVILIVRDSDAETLEFIETSNPYFLPLVLAKVGVSGVIAAMNTGLEIAQGDIITFTDDDAAPHKNWLEMIETHFLSDTQVGGVGGRDFIYINNQLWKGEKKIVGKLLFFGKMIGNHHLGIGSTREVDLLKGVNMSFRREAILNNKFDTRMLGTGAQVHFELEFCLRIKKAGWKLIYDPQVSVDHYLAKRFDEDQRDKFNETAFLNEVHNETLALLEHISPTRKIIFIFWSFFMGHRKAFGIVQFFRFLPSEGKLSAQKFYISTKGRIKGLETWLTKKTHSNKSLAQNKTK